MNCSNLAYFKYTPFLQGIFIKHINMYIYV